MQDIFDYYAVLGVPRDASAADIRRAFRSLAKALHPDSKHDPDSAPDAVDFQLVTEAYETLKDEARRKAYDEELNAVRQLTQPSASRPPRRAFAVGLALGLTLAFGAIAGLKYVDKHFNPTVKSQESLASNRPRPSPSGSVDLQAEIESTSLIPKGREPDAPQGFEPAPAEEVAPPPPMAEPSAQSAAAAPEATPANAAEPPAMAGAEPADAGEPVPPEESPKVQPPKFAASVLALESASNGAEAAIAAHRLLTLIDSSVSAKDLEEAAAWAKSPQTRKLIENRLAALRPEKPALPPKAAEHPRHDAIDGITVTTGAPGNEKVVVLKPGRGLTEGFADCPGCPDMVLVPPGQALLGAHGEGPWNLRSDSGPPRSVVLKAAFAVSRYPISIEHWRPCVEAGVCRPAPFLVASRPALPATRVSWFDAQGYVQWLSLVTGRRYRLLTETEWEYLKLDQPSRPGREGPGRPGDGAFQTQVGPLFRLGLKRVTDTSPNAWGIHPMPPGMLEWVEDCWHPASNQAPSDGSAWLSAANGDCSYRVVRGAAGFGFDGFERRQLGRAREFADVRTVEIGFRVARDVGGPTVTAFDAK